jgi:PAS domain-containing protein
MTMSSPRTPLRLDVLEELLGTGEEWLMRRILGYAQEYGYSRFTSTLEEAWRLSIRGLSGSLLEAARIGECDLEIRCEEDVAADPAVSFGIAEARLHRSRGIPLPMFYSLMKYYAQAYADLCETLEDPDQAGACAHLVRRFFDRVEIGFASEWAGLSEQAAVLELQGRNRDLTDEKVRYITIFESLNVPVVLLREDGMVENINEAAARTFGITAVTGSAYYSHVAVGETVRTARCGHHSVPVGWHGRARVRAHAPDKRRTAPLHRAHQADTRSLGQVPGHHGRAL